MSDYEEILWQGRISLSSVKWFFNPNKGFDFSPLFEQQRQDIWKSMCKIHPHLYDGEVLVLDKFSFNKELLNLYTRIIRFSCIQVYLKDNLKVPKYGSLGFQAIITDPKHKYLLIGERAHKSDYRPGYQAIPGGIYEKGDSESSLLKACLRELKEEVTIDVNQHSFYLIAMVREASGLGICLLVEVETTSPDSPLKKIQGKEEWERNILEWIKFSQIREIRHDKISERLYFLRSKLEEE